MSYYGNETNKIPKANVIHCRKFYCPHCDKEIENHRVADYGDDEIHPCEHCGKNIRWTPMWGKEDIRD